MTKPAHVCLRRRDVEVQIDTVDAKSNNIFGQVIYFEKDAQLNLGQQLVAFGLAKVSGECNGSRVRTSM